MALKMEGWLAGPRSTFTFCVMNSMDYLKPFCGADPSEIMLALHRDCEPEQIVSVFFRSITSPASSMNEREQWSRFKAIVGCPQVYDALGDKYFPVDVPVTLHYATGLETIGTLANLLCRGGVFQKFVENHHSAMEISQNFLDSALAQQYEMVEAYSCRGAWCKWFIGESILDETVLIGNCGDWWLLTVTGTD